jgi:hypothetical protein
VISSEEKIEMNPKNPKLRALLLLVVFTLGYIALPTLAGAQANNSAAKSSLAVPITGTASPSSTTSGALSSLGSGPITGTFNIQQFSVINGVVNAIGTLTASIPSAGGSSTLVLNNVAIPLASTPTASCPVLSLTLGPLHLDLLGLVIDLNQIILDITAVPGAGNLLGNLLCDVANLLNNPSGLANLLNQILGALRL